MNQKSGQDFLGKIKLDCKKKCVSLSRVILYIVILHFLFL